MSLSLFHELWRLNRQQWASSDEIEALQLARLREQLWRAWKHTRFYQDRFDSIGFHPNDLKSIEDLRKLPVTTKPELIAAEKAAMSDDLSPSDCVSMKTSGSTGSPMSISFTRHDKAHRVIKELRALFANGYKFSDRMFILVEPADIVQKKAMVQRIGLLRRYYMSIFADESEQLARIRALRPDVIYSYASSLRILAEKILTGREAVPTPKILLSAAEVMNPATRRLLASAFGVDPIDFYGSMEFGWIAWQCPERNGHHINSDCLIVECLHDGHPATPGGEGELVITNLHSDAVPLIRYSIGDAGVLSGRKCACGRTLPLLERVSGRTADCICLTGNRKLTPYSLTCAVQDVPGVRRFQIIQEAEDSILVRVISSARHNGQADSIRAAVQEALGEPVKVAVEYADRLPLEPSGKFKVVKSMVCDGKLIVTAKPRESS